MIAAFTPHAHSGEYHYPLPRANEDPFVECQEEYQTVMVIHALASSKIKRDQSLMMGWMLVQYFFNPKFKEVLPAFKPTFNTETMRTQVGFGTASPHAWLHLTPSREALEAMMTKSILSQNPEVRNYFGLLATTQTKHICKPGEFAFTFTAKGAKQMPIGQRVVITKSDYADRGTDFDIVSPQIGANRKMAKKWLTKISQTRCPPARSPALND
jgi:hypothetical protein